MAELHSLVSSGKVRKRRGRGGDRGGTCGKGHKGQKARSGPSLGKGAFEGGQMPLTRRIPKRGFNNSRFATVYEVINLATLNGAFEAGETVTKQSLVEKGIIKKVDARIKILGSGELDKKLNVYADAFSKTAQDGITKHGGQVEIIKEA